MVVLDSQLPSLISLFIFVRSISEVSFRSKSKEQLNERRAGLSSLAVMTMTTMVVEVLDGDHDDDNNCNDD